MMFSPNQSVSHRSGVGAAPSSNSPVGSRSCWSAKRAYKATVNSDGYRWLKYGQKFLTNSQLYREYFRCAEHGCSAKKHVEVEPSTGKVVSSSSTVHNHGLSGPTLADDGVVAPIIKRKKPNNLD
eukprot:TRINITY_DN1053_c0_g1_i1.p2 TRINITY_DN1053_c0_g1~~TRINITY_DN1053_c0_g1_i1.p2  ORF type:complete len:125 (-),score=6.27 TRINITY_DN1053_c0_g1_i1:172-546(-)